MPNPSLRKKLVVHAGQRTVLDDLHRYKVIVAGRRWGKTQTAKISIIQAAQKPNKLVWYVAPTYRMARGIMWNELIATIPPKLIAWKHETLLAIRLINGSLIELKGADKPDTLRGVGLDFLVMDEAQDIKFETWTTVLRPTLAQSRSPALFIGTPKAFNWLYEIYMMGQRGNVFTDKKSGKKHRNQWKSWQFPTITSPFIPEDEIEAARADMDERTFRQEFEASFETMSGRVYYAFDRRVNMGEYKFDPKLPIWIGQDFNIDPMSSVVMQPQQNGEVWVVDEVVLFGSNTQETADEIARRYYKQIDNIIVYPDPAGASRSTKGRGESDLEILRDSGLRHQKYRRKHPRVADRVNAVNRMLKSASGDVRLRVDRGCKHTVKAFEETIYKPGSREVDKTAGVEHPADGLGYCIDIEFPVRKIKMSGLSL